MLEYPFVLSDRSERKSSPSVRADETTLHDQCARIAVLESEGIFAHTDGPKTGQAYAIRRGNRTHCQKQHENNHGTHRHRNPAFRANAGLVMIHSLLTHSSAPAKRNRTRSRPYRSTPAHPRPESHTWRSYRRTWSPWSTVSTWDSPSTGTAHYFP